jgi:hypothetical protein
MTSSIRRTVAALSALALLIIGVQLIGTSSASAHANELSGVPGCQTSTGTYNVVWTVINDYNGPDTVTIVTSAPGGTFNPTTLNLPPKGSGTLTQSGIAGNATSASLKVHGNWTDPKDPWQGDTALVTVPLPGTCVAPPPNHETPQVTHQDGACVNNVVSTPSYTIPNDSDVTYTVTTGGTSTVKPAGTYPVPGGGHFVVDASSKTVTLTGTQHWDFTLTVASGDCGLTTATPALPTVTDTSCVNHAPVPPTLAYPNTTGVTYSPPAGTFEAGKTITVTATAATGYKFDDTAADWPKDWTEVNATHATTPVSFKQPVNCGQSVTPASPSATQTSCPAGRTTPLAPTLTLPDDSAALVYTAKVISSNTSGFTAHSVTTPYQPGQTVLVTATAQGTYFFDTVANGWSKVSDTVATLTIHFNALGANECTVSEKATQAGFTAEQCVSGTPKGGTYTIPSTTGVVYTVNGTTTKAGSYPAAPKSTVNVVAAAKTGYTLVGQTTWTHTFGATPQCSNTAPVQVHKPSDVDSARTSNNNLAATGVPTENLLTIGFGLLIIGSLSMLLATRRRDSE